MEERELSKNDYLNVINQLGLGCFITLSILQMPKLILYCGIPSLILGASVIVKSVSLANVDKALLFSLVFVMLSSVFSLLIPGYIIRKNMNRK